jgi:hypothetical protein
MNYNEYIAYHRRGDAAVEERMIASLAKYFNLSQWDTFKLIYFYSMTYHIPSALLLLFKPTNTQKKDLVFRTDRRFVRCNGAYDRLLKELNVSMLHSLQSCKTTEEAYNTVRKWFFFGRYTAFLFLEVYYNCFRPKWYDNLRFKWETNENYTKGAVHIIGTNDLNALNAFLERAKKDTADNCFAIETSICAVAKFIKGTRWDGYYTERLLDNIVDSEYKNIIISLL